MIRVKQLLRRRLNRSWSVDILLFLLLAGVAVFMSAPLVYTVNRAFMPLDEIFAFPPRFIVRNPTVQNFKDLLGIFSDSWVPFSRYVFNTFFIAIVGTVGHVIIASAAAYPLAKVKFPLRGLLFNIVVLSLMFTPYITQVPNYMTISWLGMINSYWAILIPVFGMTLGLYLMKQFMEQIPDALIDQLAVGARLIAPVGGEQQILTLIERTGTRQWRETQLDRVLFVPLKSGII